MDNVTGETPPAALLEPVLAIAQSAAHAIMQVYGSGFDATRKQDDSPLTAADTASHEIICAGLRELNPALPILSEEAALLPFSKRRAWNRYWLVDPLDGTREFIKRNGEFTVNIALIESHRPVLGVVLAPASGVCHYASAGGGAFRSNADGDVHSIRTRKTVAGKITAVGSRSHGTPQQQAFFAALGSGAAITTIGSSLKFCLLAEGAADVYPRFGPTSEWDTAAAQCVLEEAGGRVMTLDGMDLRYNTRETLLNPFFIALGDPVFDWTQYT